MFSYVHDIRPCIERSPYLKGLLQLMLVFLKSGKAHTSNALLDTGPPVKTANKTIAQCSIGVQNCGMEDCLKPITFDGDES